MVSTRLMVNKRMTNAEQMAMFQTLHRKIVERRQKKKKEIRIMREKNEEEI